MRSTTDSLVRGRHITTDDRGPTRGLRDVNGPVVTHRLVSTRVSCKPHVPFFSTYNKGKCKTTHIGLYTGLDLRSYYF